MKGFYATSAGKTYFFAATDPGNKVSISAIQSDTPGANATDFTTICFYPGTLVRTPSGEVAVEALKAGDLVLTA